MGEEIKFEGGQSIRSKTVIWSAGVMGVIPDGISKDVIVKGNKIKTNDLCQVEGYKNIFAIGDVGAMITDETP